MTREQEIRLQNAVTTNELIEVIDLLRTAIYQISQSSMMTLTQDPNLMLIDTQLDATENALDQLRVELRNRTVIDMRQ